MMENLILYALALPIGLAIVVYNTWASKKLLGARLPFLAAADTPLKLAFQVVWTVALMFVMVLGTMILLQIFVPGVRGDPREPLAWWLMMLFIPAVETAVFQGVPISLMSRQKLPVQILLCTLFFTGAHVMAIGWAGFAVGGWLGWALAALYARYARESALKAFGVTFMVHACYNALIWIVGHLA